MESDEILLIMMMIGGYLLPTMIAYTRSHNNTIALFALNLLGGWTGFLWLAALVWSLLNINAKDQEVSRGERSLPDTGR